MGILYSYTDGGNGGDRTTRVSDFKVVNIYDESDIESESTVVYGNYLTSYYEQKPQTGRFEHYSFNTAGQTISARDQNGNALFSKQGMSGGAKNKVTFASKVQKNISNLLKNHDFEKDTSSDSLPNYTVTKGTNENAVIKGLAENDLVLIGSRALKLFKSVADTNESVRVQQQVLNLQGGKFYTFSTYVKTEVQAMGSNANAAGAVICRKWRRGISKQGSDFEC